MTVRPATALDIPAITAIFNEAVANSNAVWTEKQETEADRLAWMIARRALGYPVVVATAGSDVVGYGTFGDFRSWPGYRYSVEHSVYIHAGHRGRGLGRSIIDDLVSTAAALGKHVLIAGIDAIVPADGAFVNVNDVEWFTSSCRCGVVSRCFSLAA
jgi:phosphinothricin acetyltransferase